MKMALAMTLSYLQKFSLEGKVALITGAARDIGFEIAQAMAGSGAHVILNGRDPIALAAAAERLQQQGWAASLLPFDIRDSTALKQAFADIALRHGRLDILVSNAGLRERKLLQDFSDDDLQRMFDTNLIAPYRLAREAAKLMLPQRSGRLIFVTSIAGQIARSGDAVYTGAKQGVTGMMRALANEYGPQGITSNAIAPGGVATESNAAMIADKAAQEHFAKRTPLGRWAEAEEIAGAAVFLASPAASYVNGHVLTVDGGMSIAM
jgi:gluconate 5-dehydrogenase